MKKSKKQHDAKASSSMMVFASTLFTFLEKDYFSFYHGLPVETLQMVADLVGGGAHNLRQFAEELRTIQQYRPTAQCSLWAVSTDFLLEVQADTETMDRLKTVRCVDPLEDSGRAAAIRTNQTYHYEL